VRIVITIAAVAIVLVYYVGWKYNPAHVYAETKSCRIVYVKSGSGRYVNVYTDSRLTTLMANPFIVNGDKWEIHTIGIKDLAIQEVPCQ
jgi:hypothetical protein